VKFPKENVVLKGGKFSSSGLSVCTDAPSSCFLVAVVRVTKSLCQFVDNFNYNKTWL